MSKKRWSGRIYLGRDAEGKQLIKWVGRFDTKRERDDAVALARIELKKGGSVALPTCDEYVDRYLAHYSRHNRISSYDTQRQRLSRFKKDFAGRSLDIRRSEARDWINAEGEWAKEKPVNKGYIQAIISLYNHAIDEDDLPLERNPFRKLGERTKGRADQAPPTEDEMELLLASCAALKDYEQMMASFLRFAVWTLMRPSELYELEWADIDFDRMLIDKGRRLYRGTVDEPKTGRKVIPLTPPAREAIIGLPRDGRLVFRNKTEGRLSASTMHGYWSKVLVKADLDFDLYHATKHYGVHMLWTKLGMSERAIAAQAGWKVNTVRKMLDVYGHGDVGAIEEVHAAFANNVRELRAVRGTQS